MTAPSPLFSQLARSGAAVVVIQGLRLILRFGSMMVLARLLAPEAFGLFGMASLIYGLLQTVRDLGLGTVAIQRGEQSPAERTQFFWLQAAAGLGVAALTCLLAGPAAGYFGQPELRALLPALAVAFVLGGIGGQFRVELSRGLLFRRISLIEVTGLAAGLGSAIALASAGWSYWSLVLMVLVQEGVSAAGFYLATSWRPRGQPTFTDTGEHLRRGLHLCGHNLTRYATHMVDQALVASRFGPLDLGYYGRAWQLGTLPTHGLLAGLHTWMGQGLVRLRDDPAAFRDWCRQVLNLLLYGCTVLTAVFAVAPETVLQVLLGPGWAPAARPLAWLALTIPLQAWTFLELSILIACRQERRLFAWSVVRLGVLGGAVWLGGTATVEAVAQRLAAGQACLLLPGLLLIARSSPFQVGDTVRAAVAPLLLGLSTGLLLILSQAWWSGSAYPLLALALIVLAVTGGFVVAWPRVRRELAGAWRLLRGRIP